MKQVTLESLTRSTTRFIQERNSCWICCVFVWVCFCWWKCKNRRIFCVWNVTYYITLFISNCNHANIEHNKFSHVTLLSKYKTKTHTGAFMPHILNRVIVTSVYWSAQWKHALSRPVFVLEWQCQLPHRYKNHNYAIIVDEILHTHKIQWQI